MLPVSDGDLWLPVSLGGGYHDGAVIGDARWYYNIITCIRYDTIDRALIGTLLMRMCQRVFLLSYHNRQ